MVVHIFPRHLRKENDKKRFKKPRVFFQKPLIEGQIKQWCVVPLHYSPFVPLFPFSTLSSSTLYILYWA
jgi:hypothetical protein